MGNSLVVQWLRLWTFIAKGMSSIPGRRTKIPQAVQCGQKQKKNTQKNQTKKQKSEWPDLVPNGWPSHKKGQ